MRIRAAALTLSASFSVLFATGAFAAETAGGHDSEVAGQPNPLNNLYFGEQHLHTSASVDAFVMGNRKNDIEDAFNYNKGKPVKKWITGDTQMSAVWTDPDFDPSQHAVYYVRVLEIPTPRWSTYDAKTLGIDPPAGYPATQQERAWSSPIWYTPDPRIAAKAKYEAVVHGAGSR